MKKILLLATLLSITSIGHGQVLLINDTFNRTGGLNGTDPTSSNVPESWTAATSITTDGSSAFVGASNLSDSVTGYIGIPVPTPGNLTVGKTYTLQIDMGQSHQGPWTTAGFGTETNTEDWPGGTGNSVGFWAIENGNGVEIIEGGTPVFYNGALPGGATVALTIQVGALSDTLSASINGTQVALKTNVNDPILQFVPLGPVSLAPISDVFIGEINNSFGNFANLSLTEVPEPSTWAMLLSGVGALFVVQRLRRKLSL